MARSSSSSSSPASAKSKSPSRAQAKAPKAAAGRAGSASRDVANKARAATQKASAKASPAKAAPTKPSPTKAAPAKPLDESSAFDALQALHTAVSRFDQAAARELSLKRSDVACLRLLSGGGKRASEIGQALGLTSGSVTALIDRLQAAKLVKRSESDADRRAIHVELMPATQRRLAKAYEPLTSALDAALGGKKRATIEALLSAARSLSSAGL